MKKFSKIFGAALVFAAITVGISAEEWNFKFDVNDEKTFTKFNPEDFKGEWIKGDWDFTSESTESETVQAFLSIGPEKVSEDSYDYITEMTAVINGKEQTVETSSKDFRDLLIGFEGEMKNLVNYSKKNVVIKGKPYFVINKDKTVIVFEIWAKEGKQQCSGRVVLQRNFEDNE